MKISKQFNKFYFGAILKDIKNNLDKIEVDNYVLNIKQMSVQNIHTLFKIMCGVDKSLTEMDSKEVTKYIEDIRKIAANNGYTLKIDQDEWDRIMAYLE